MRASGRRTAAGLVGLVVLVGTPAALMVAAAAPAGAGSQSVTANGTFVVPAGVCRVAIDAIGGSGANAVSDFGAAGHAGGGGGEVQATIPVSPGDALVVTIGHRGTDVHDTIGGSGQSGGTGFVNGGSGANGASGGFGGAGGAGATAVARSSTVLVVAGGGGAAAWGDGAVGGGVGGGGGGGLTDGSGANGANGATSGGLGGSGGASGGGGGAGGAGGSGGASGVGGSGGGAGGGGGAGAAATAGNGGAGGGGGFSGGGGGGGGGSNTGFTIGAGGGGGGSSHVNPSASPSSVVFPNPATPNTGDGKVIVSFDPTTDSCPTPVVVAPRFTG